MAAEIKDLELARDIIMYLLECELGSRGFDDIARGVQSDPKNVKSTIEEMSKALPITIDYPTYSTPYAYVIDFGGILMKFEKYKESKRPPSNTSNMESEKSGTKTFISYSRSDSEFALKLAEELRNNGSDIWLDQLDIPPGDNWDDEIENALEGCYKVLVILSLNSVKSSHVKNEISYAIKNRKKILTLMYIECNVPLSIHRVQHIDLTKDYDEGFKRLSKAPAERWST